MDQEQIKYLTDEQRDRYKKMADLFEMPGWEVLKNWARINADEARDRGASATSWEMNRIAFGERIVYDIIKQLDEINEREYSVLADENRARAEEDDIVETELLHE